MKEITDREPRSARWMPHGTRHMFSGDLTKQGRWEDGTSEYGREWSCFCEECGVRFIARNMWAVVCGRPECVRSRKRKHPSQEERRIRSAIAREKVCEVCGESFTARRSDARACSAACKQKAYRQRQSAAREKSGG